MKLDFRIEWGYQILYSRRHYHPVYCWDGDLECENGELQKLFLYHYPRCISGPINSAVETPLTGNSWQESTRRALSGLHVIAEAVPETVFHLHTASGDFTFTAEQIINDGRIVFDVGPKYGYCHVTVTRTGYLWFRPELRKNEVAVEPGGLGLPVHEWFRMNTAWLAGGDSVKFKLILPCSGEQVFHFIGMAAREYTPGKESDVSDTFPMQLKCDGTVVAEFKHYFRKHYIAQLLEDVWTHFTADAGEHEFELVNCNPAFYLLINRLSIFPSAAGQNELNVPRWVIAGERTFGSIRAEKSGVCRVNCGGKSFTVELQKGWNEFPFVLDEPGKNVEITTDTGLRAVVSEVWGVVPEKKPLMVGGDLTSVPHDDSGEMEWFFNYLNRTRMGNLIIIRNHVFKNPDGEELLPVSDELLEKWGKYCREHDIYVEAASDFESGVLAKAAAEFMHAAGTHELTGVLYAWDPDHELRPASMREASENYVNFLKKRTGMIRESSGCPVGLGDASGGQRYCYQGGVDFIRAETMVPNTMHICSLARTASESLSNGEWGVHIATQHAMQPYFANQAGLFFLSLYQSWLMGANMFYEEDSFALMWKEERQCWDDALTKGKRELLRQFFRFAKTHPRQGQTERPIAFLEGRYAAPFNGFVCGGEQTPDYSVWGKFGNNLPEWGHAQPEKCRQILDVLMPGCLTHPLRQKFDKQRLFFSGTPYGDFDEVPVEASGEFFKRYKLLLNLGWNTMLPEDYEKLRSFVADGGTLFSGLPQFGTQEKRDFSDFRLWNGGDLSELCGIKVYGAAQHEYCGQWNGRDKVRVADVELSAMPSRHPGEDGSCRLASVELAGAEVAAWDSATGLPLLTCYRYGKGKVYVLTAWAYPGHEALQKFSAAWVAYLAKANRGEWFVEDESSEVFWSVRRFADRRCGQISLLNTDWTQPGNRKTVRICAGNTVIEHDVVERVPLQITVAGSKLLETDNDNYLEYIGTADGKVQFKLYSTAVGKVKIYSADGVETLNLAVSPAGVPFEVSL